MLLLLPTACGLRLGPLAALRFWLRLGLRLLGGVLLLCIVTTGIILLLVLVIILFVTFLLKPHPLMLSSSK